MPILFYWDCSILGIYYYLIKFLPFDLRNSMIPSQFKIKLAKHYWNMASTEIEQPEDEWFFQSSDVGD